MCILLYRNGGSIVLQAEGGRGREREKIIGGDSIKIYTVLAKKSSRFYTVKLCKNVNFFLASTVLYREPVHIHVLYMCIFIFEVKFLVLFFSLVLNRTIYKLLITLR